MFETTKQNELTSTTSFQTWLKKINEADRNTIIKLLEVLRYDSNNQSSSENNGINLFQLLKICLTILNSNIATLEDKKSFESYTALGFAHPKNLIIITERIINRDGSSNYLIKVLLQKPSLEPKVPGEPEVPVATEQICQFTLESVNEALVFDRITVEHKSSQYF